MHDAVWAPWRLQYLNAVEQDGGTLSDFIAHCWDHPEDDMSNHVIVRDELGLIMLNRHPYAAGHLLVALGEAKARLIDYQPPARDGLWALIERAWTIMHETLQPQGINMGINEGAASGAGLPGHLHAHLVPRWHGDVNFMGTLAGCRVIPASLEDIATQYRNACTR